MTIAATLADEEKVQIRHHLGFMNAQEAATFVLGVPASLETQFVIEAAFTKILPAALGLVRKLLARCEATEAQYFDDQENLAVEQVGSIKLRADEGEQLMQVGGRYDYWRQGLANALGIWCNPYDRRFALGAGTSGINVSVRG